MENFKLYPVSGVYKTLGMHLENCITQFKTRKEIKVKQGSEKK
jgi:hypothetical protein